MFDSALFDGFLFDGDTGSAVTPTEILAFPDPWLSSYLPLIATVPGTVDSSVLLCGLGAPLVTDGLGAGLVILAFPDPFLSSIISTAQPVNPEPDPFASGI